MNMYIFTLKTRGEIMLSNVIDPFCSRPIFNYDSTGATSKINNGSIPSSYPACPIPNHETGSA